jgi:hypothetical protein
MGYELSAEDPEMPAPPPPPHEGNDPIAAEDRQRMGQWLSQFLR